VTTEIRLLPNLGAEEGSDWRRHLHEPRVAAAACLWRLLFPFSTPFVGVPDAPSDWPERLDVGRDEPAFAWLSGMSGCVPWLSNHDAQRAAADAGLAIAGPDPEVVERVHDKAFALRAADAAGLVPAELRGTAHVLEPADLEDATRALARIRTAVEAWPAFTSGRFTLKPRDGTSGRGRFDSRDGRVDEARLRAALPRLAARRGAILEPWLDRTQDFSVQVHVGARGALILGSLRMRVAASGAYVGHRGEIDARGDASSGSPFDAALREAATGVAQAAMRAGFRGPASVDAFAFRIESAAGPQEILRPVVELNARFTMGTVALGLLRRARAALSARGVDPGGLRAFAFVPAAPAVDWERARSAAGPGAVLLPLAAAGDPMRAALLLADRSESLDAALATAGLA